MFVLKINKKYLRISPLWPPFGGWWPLLLDRKAGGLLAAGAVGASARGGLAVTILTQPARASVAN
jgi:hypothetical protein